MRPAPLTVVVVASLALAGRSPAQDLRSAPRTHYFVDFRANSSGVLGHTFVLYGRVDGRNRVIEANYAGLDPYGPVADSALIAVFPAQGRYSFKNENPGLPPTVIYRRRLGAKQYAHLQLTLRRLRATRQPWHVLFYNCNDFAGQIAREMGMWSPPTFMPPNAYVRALRAINEP